jgi:hypothetical protein
MNHPILSRIPILGKFVDERFLAHRLRSSSFAGIAGCLVAVGIFEYRFIFQHVLSWDLLAFASTMAAVKIAMMLWYGCTD